jgi:hypothetical protein
MAGGWSKLVSMELDDEDKIDACCPIPMADRPDYPYGLRISFSEKELKKLGLELPDIGDMIDMRVFATVTSVNEDKTASGEHQRVEMQIEKISAESEMNEGK